MRFLTPTEQRLLESLPGDERAVLAAFFEECDARLVTERDTAPGPAVPVALDRANGAGRFDSSGQSLSVTSQDALFPMHKKEARP